jgi:hypothetical protein
MEKTFAARTTTFAGWKKLLPGGQPPFPDGNICIDLCVEMGKKNLQAIINECKRLHLLRIFPVFGKYTQLVA